MRSIPATSERRLFPGPTNLSDWRRGYRADESRVYERDSRNQPPSPLRLTGQRHIDLQHTS